MRSRTTEPREFTASTCTLTKGVAATNVRSMPRLDDIQALLAATAEPGLRAATIAEALSDLAEGKMIVIVDDEERENEGDLVMAAEYVTAEAINFMAMYARGWLCLALDAERCKALELPLMAAKNEALHRTPFTVTIDAREGVTTGTSAADRAHTIRTAADPRKGPDEIVHGGHVSPLKARRGGVLERAGHTEASVDLARLAGCSPAGVICGIVNDDGTMARAADLERFCAVHGVKLVTVADLIAHRRRSEMLVERVVEVALPTEYGLFNAVGYRSVLDDAHYLALVTPGLEHVNDPLVRVHSQCVPGDLFHSIRCDCALNLNLSLHMIQREGGVLVYLPKEGLDKFVHRPGLATMPADLWDYGTGAQILVDLGLTSIRLLTNTPKRIHALDGYGLEVVNQLPVASELLRSSTA
jgi:3,4-dihydroxy 2-butanone 4-phosphate synthase / GTP cyclohydrolase II